MWCSGLYGAVVRQSALATSKSCSRRKKNRYNTTLLFTNFSKISNNGFQAHMHAKHGICTLDRKIRHFVSSKTWLRFRVRVRAGVSVNTFSIKCSRSAKHSWMHSKSTTTQLAKKTQHSIPLTTATLPNLSATATVFQSSTVAEVTHRG